MSNDLLDAMEAGDVDKIQSSFETIMATKIMQNVEQLKQEVAKDLFTGEK